MRTEIVETGPYAHSPKHRYWTAEGNARRRPSTGRYRHATADLRIVVGKRSDEMVAKALTPILNVSDLEQSFQWFEKLGWKRGWDWGSPPTFGGVCSGECEVFLCQGGQGGRGQSGYRATFGPDSNEAAETAVWMSVWVDDVDAIHRRCVERGIEITWPPTDMPWGVREMHIRHPDGHVFRVSRSTHDAACDD